MAGLAYFSVTVVLLCFQTANPLQSFLAGKLLSEGRGHVMLYDRDPLEYEEEYDPEDPDDPQEERWSYHPNQA